MPRSIKAKIFPLESGVPRNRKHASEMTASHVTAGWRIATLWMAAATGLLALGAHDLTAGEHKLTVEIVGANDKAVKAYMFAIDYVKLDPL